MSEGEKYGSRVKLTQEGVATEYAVLDGPSEPISAVRDLLARAQPLAQGNRAERCTGGT
jgi:hypothetical protein